MSKAIRKVLEIGSADINGSARQLFPSNRFDYKGCDIGPGINVDKVVGEGQQLPFKDGEFDIVYSLQTFEQAPRFWELFSEMKRVCSQQGVIIVIAPSSGAEHRFPVDCYRFLPDAFRELASRNALEIVQLWRDDTGPFHDIVSVFHHKGNSDREKVQISKADYELVHTWFTPSNKSQDDQSVESGSGTMPYTAFLKGIHNALSPNKYVEIGVWRGTSLSLSSCAAVAIDPFPMTAEIDTNRIDLYVGSSDDFFLHEECRRKINGYDLAYVDGLHHIEFALKDFMNLERQSSNYTVIAIDDIYPAHVVQSRRIRESSYWTGDVWKIIKILKEHRTDLRLLPVNTYPSGTLLIIGCDSDNATLWSAYDYLAEVHSRDCDPGDNILFRTDSLAPDDPLICNVMRRLRDLRAGKGSIDEIKKFIDNAMPRTIAGVKS